MSRATQFAVGATLWMVVVLPLALLVHGHWSPLLDLDLSIVDDLQPETAGSSLARGVASVVTTAGTSWFRFLVLTPVLVWAWRTGRRRLALLLVVAGGLIGVVTTVLKLVVGRARPDFPDPIYVSDSLSHPSGHASGIATLVGLLLVAFLRLQQPRTRWLSVVGGLLLVTAVGLTRIALGAHYPSDVVAGYALGAGWVLMLTAVFDAAPRPVEETAGTPA